MAPSRPASRIAVIGRGRLGTALAKAIKERKDLTLTGHFSARASTLTGLAKLQSEVLIIACKDDKISEVAAKAIPHVGEELKLLVHCAGSIGPSVLPKQRGVARLMLHPLQTFATSDPLLFAGISWGVCSSDPTQLHWARSFTSSLGAQQLIPVKEEDLPLYHALAVFASNAITLLGASIEVLSQELGQRDSVMKKALTPLMRQAFRNVVANKASRVLTGPIVRGDQQTINNHLKALKKVSPALRDLYACFVAFAKTAVLKSSGS